MTSIYARSIYSGADSTYPTPSPDSLTPTFPFGTPQSPDLPAEAYLTSQHLIQQVSYLLSDKLFVYSPSSFSLSEAATTWAATGQRNGFGEVTGVVPTETRLGAASVLLGYVLSKDLSQDRKGMVQSIIASSASLLPMQNALSQLALLYGVSSPFVAHISALDYDVQKERLVTDYVTPLSIARETGLALIATGSVHEAQDMALFATLVAEVLPVINVVDGVKVGRETGRVKGVVSRDEVFRIWESITGEFRGLEARGCKGKKIARLLDALNAELGTGYGLFQYTGAADAEVVLVVFGSVEASLGADVARYLNGKGKKVGVVSVRVYSPFMEAEFLKVLPKSVRKIAVLGQVKDEAEVQDETVRSLLYGDVFSAVTLAEEWSLPPPVVDVKYSRDQVWSPRHFGAIFEQLVGGAEVEVAKVYPKEGEQFLTGSGINQYTFWDIDDAETAKVSAVLARALATHRKNVSYTSTYDNGAQAGVIQSEIRRGDAIIEAPFHVDYADVVVVGKPEILKSFDVVAGLKQGGTLLVKGAIKEEELEKKIGAQVLKDLVRKHAKFYILDPTNETELVDYESGLLELAFFKIANAGYTQESAAKKLASLSSPDVLKIVEKIPTALREVPVLKEWAAEPVVAEGEEAPAPVEILDLPAVPTSSAFTINDAKLENEPRGILKSSQHAAKLLSFKEAYNVTPALRPDLNVKNFVVKVQENKRLTPASYDRNIFHIDFDLTGTGLTYEIGEALGVHAHNDRALIDRFITFYGLNPEDLVEVPSREDPSILETRTVYQSLLQNLDIFGKPPKKFYELLAPFATDDSERKALLTLVSPEGAAEFKRLSEVDNVTYADVLLDYPSAHPDFHDLVKIVNPMKRREYSIASSQQVNPNSVQLLIVVVGWKDNRGRDRWGQASRYLSLLPIGAEVTVSVKPSVMKLPPLSTAVSSPTILPFTSKY